MDWKELMHRVIEMLDQQGIPVESAQAYFIISLAFFMRSEEVSTFSIASTGRT